MPRKYTCEMLLPEKLKAWLLMTASSSPPTLSDNAYPLPHFLKD